MAKKNPPTVRMRRLGAQLRKIRDERGLTLDDAADLLKLSKSALSRMENAQVVVRPFEVRYLLLVYGVTDEDLRDSLMGLAAAGRSKDWVRRHRDLSPGKIVRDLVRLEQDSSAIRIFQPFGIPGLMQIPPFTRAVVMSVPRLPGDDVERAVAFRMARKEVLSRPTPVRLDAVIGEAALRQKMGGPAVLLAQLRHLLEVAEADNVTVQVLPFDSDKHPGYDGSFTMLDVETGAFTVVIVDGLVRSAYLEDEEDVERYSVVFEELRAAALSETESRRLIEQVISELEASLEGTE